jgi:hypothetical protein
MSNLRVAIVFALGVTLGYALAVKEDNHSMCSDYATKYSDWHGWLSVKDGVYRCFWLESAYPWRTRQGIVEVEK